MQDQHRAVGHILLLGFGVGLGALLGERSIGQCWRHRKAEDLWETAIFQGIFDSFVKLAA